MKNLLEDATSIKIFIFFTLYEREEIQNDIWCPLLPSLALLQCPSQASAHATQSPHITFYYHLPSISLHGPTTMPSAPMSQLREQTKSLSDLMVNLANSRVAGNKDHASSFALTFRVDWGASC